MMKQHSKSVIAFILALAVSLPSFAAAQTEAGSTTKPARQNFCTMIDSLSQRVEEGIAKRDINLTEKRSEARRKLDERFLSIDTRRADNRTGWDAERDAWQAKLLARASTTAQKAAVEKFISSIDAAVTARRSAVDAAVKDYRSALRSAVVVRQGAVDALLATFRTETSTALAKAKADCALNVTPKTVRESYVAGMKAAKEKLRTGVKALESRKDTLHPLLDARKQAVDKAVADFKAAVEKARLELKNAMVSS